MVEMEVVYRGALRTEGTHGPSATRIETDAPVDNHGKGERHSPTDLLASSLGACMLTLMGIRAQVNGWSIDGTRARVEKHMVTAPVRRVGRLVVEIEVPPGVPQDARRVLEDAARTCPVAESIHPGIELQLRLDFR